MMLMSILSVALPLGCALLLIYEQRSCALGSPIPERLLRIIALGLSTAALGLCFLHGNLRLGDFDRGDFFHHYLGSKYSTELGYTRLYACAIAAESELDRSVESGDRRVRDLTTTQLVQVNREFVERALTLCRTHFAPMRWNAFQQDVSWFYENTSADYWDAMVSDHGANMTPVGVVVGKLVANLARPSTPFFQAVAGADAAMIFGSIVLLFWGFGFRVGAIACVFLGCNAPFNSAIGLGFLRQDWLLLLVASLCLARRRMFSSAGFVMCWGSLLRVFPIILLVPWVVVAIWCLLRRNSASSRLRTDSRRILIGVGLCIVTLVPISIQITSGSTYADFSQRIRVHAATPLLTGMGAEVAVAHRFAGRVATLYDDGAADPLARWREQRQDRSALVRTLHAGMAMLFCGWAFWSLYKTRLLWCMPPTFVPLVFALTTLSGYYYSLLVLMSVLGLTNNSIGPLLLVTAAATQVIQQSYVWVDDRYAAQSWLTILFFVLAFVARSRSCAASAR